MNQKEKALNGNIYQVRECVRKFIIDEEKSNVENKEIDNEFKET